MVLDITGRGEGAISVPESKTQESQQSTRSNTNRMPAKGSNLLPYHSFFSESNLRLAYHSGVGYYTYSNCQSIDVVASIRVVAGSSPDDTIMIPSSAHQRQEVGKVTSSTVRTWVDSMRKIVNDVSGNGAPKTVCLVVLLGCKEYPKLQQPGELMEFSESSLCPFPREDAYRLVCVPEDDAFGVTKAVSSLGLVLEESESYSSHGFLRAEETSKGTLQSNTKISIKAKKIHEALNKSPIKTSSDDGHVKL